jgi:hypothetical protein
MALLATGACGAENPGQTMAVLATGACGAENPGQTDE